MACPAPFFVTRSETIRCDGLVGNEDDIKKAWIKLGTQLYADALAKCRAGGGNCVPGQAELTVDSPKIEALAGQPGKCSFEVSMYITCREPPKTVWDKIKILFDATIKGLAAAAACFVLVYGFVAVGPSVARKMATDPKFASGVREFAKAFASAAP